MRPQRKHVTLSFIQLSNSQMPCRYTPHSKHFLLQFTYKQWQEVNQLLYCTIHTFYMYKIDNITHFLCYMKHVNCRLFSLFCTANHYSALLQIKTFKTSLPNYIIREPVVTVFVLVSGEVFVFQHFKAFCELYCCSWVSRGAQRLSSMGCFGVCVTEH